ncbi:MAG TPA: YHS domain-containing (seleno)protein [Gemmatimonadales bacterium]|nr:YHS domain-containing (seleno)protein [Gemmatimonadales bacterium]
MFRRSFPARLALAGFLLAGTAAGLRAQAVNVDQDHLALYGYDAVAYQTDQAAVKGAPEYTAVYEGNTYRFASAAHREAFRIDPAKYVPAYGGYCAYGVANGHKVKVDPEAFRVVEGKLYLNYDKGVQKKWLADIPGNIAKAEKNWAGLKDKPRD